jgi:anti-sigma regulatory factor (Ser/Thr protein kinase)
MTADPPSDPSPPAGPAGDGVLLADTGRTLAALDQAFDSGTLYALRAAVQAHAFAAGMPERRIDDVVIAIHELAANAIQHGAGRGRLRMWRVPGALRFQVEDSGATSGAKRASSDRDRADAADRWPYLRGHGLWLVREVADQMSLSSGPNGTRASVIFAFPR